MGFSMLYSGGWPCDVYAFAKAQVFSKFVRKLVCHSDYESIMGVWLIFWLHLNIVLSKNTQYLPSMYC